MPNKIKSAKQFRFMEGMANGMKPLKSVGPSPAVAKEMLGSESEIKKKKFAKMPRFK